MDIDDDGTQRAATVKDYGLKPDFDELDEEAKEVHPFPLARGVFMADGQDGSEEIGRGIEDEVNKMKADLEKLAPDMKAIER